MRRLFAKAGIAAALIGGIVGSTATSASGFLWYEHIGYGGEAYSGPYCGFNSAYGYWDKASSWDNGDEQLASAWDYQGSGMYVWLWDMGRYTNDNWVGSNKNDRADSYENYC